MDNVYIIDGVCGIGKTSGAINMIKSSSSEDRFLYITPFLAEVQRVKTECKSKRFKEPKSFGTKLEGIKYLFSKKENVVSTHALFRMFDTEVMDLAYLNNYTLVMDEVADVVEMLDISKKDLDIIIDNFASIGENGFLKWDDEEYKGKYDEYKRLCDINCIFIYGEGSRRMALVWMFPIDVFKAFKDVYILTYMFDAQIQKYYFDFYGLEYKHLYIKNFEITEEKQEYSLAYIKDLIKICDDEKLNKIGNSYNAINNEESSSSALSLSWYRAREGGSSLETLKNNCYNYFRHIVKTKTSDNMWTVFKEFRDDIKGDGYSKGFVSVSMRATNDFKHKKSVAYLVNRYLNPVIKNFFVQKGVDVNEDLFAISELVQFLFRSQIREGKEVNLYIPSARMRMLLQRWISELE